MDVGAYLRRIDYRGPLDPTSETLSGLHRAHLLAVPFENLDIFLGRPIILDEERIYEKIVGGRRGGFCYELNGLFARLLRELGFVVELLAAEVSDGEGNWGIAFDHIALRVKLNPDRLADVGFGDSFIEPLLLEGTGAQTQERGCYNIISRGQYKIYQMLDNGSWRDQYRFTLEPHALIDFSGGCEYHQTSPASGMTKRRVCSRATPEGRITLSDMKWITTKNGEREMHLLSDDAEYWAILWKYFKIRL